MVAKAKRGRIHLLLVRHVSLVRLGKIKVSAQPLPLLVVQLGKIWHLCRRLAPLLQGVGFSISTTPGGQRVGYLALHVHVHVQSARPTSLQIQGPQHHQGVMVAWLIGTAWCRAVVCLCLGGQYVIRVGCATGLLPLVRVLHCKQLVFKVPVPTTDVWVCICWQAWSSNSNPW